MRNFVKLLGITALAAVIGFSFAACDNGGGGGGGRGPGTPSGPVTPSVPLSAEYVSYDADGTEYKLVITEAVTGRAAYNPKKDDKYTLTITFNDENGNKTVKISTGTVASVTSATIELKPAGNATAVTVTVSSTGNTNTIISFSADIPVDSGDPVRKPEALSYALNEEGTGYILIKGIVKPNGEANILDKLPDNKPVTAIGGGAFYGNTDLTSITIPASVTSIGDGAFAGCTNLATVTFAQGSQLKTIGAFAFEDCTSLTGIIIPASVTTIGTADNNWAGTFQYCTSLATVTFAEGSQLEIIGNGMFQHCTSLTGITIPASVTEIGHAAFSFFYFDDEGEASFISNSLTTVTFTANSRLKTIGEGAFEGTGITSITIPGSVTTIGSSAFRWTNLSSVTIPAAVTAIGVFDNGWGAFADCTNLTTVTFAANSQLKTIGMGAFARSTSLTSITIPSSVTEIGIWAFCFMYLGSITIPESVTSIGSQAFAGWGPTQRINVQGSTAGWNNDWALYCDATINYNVP
jgi:hypothetical protein